MKTIKLMGVCLSLVLLAGCGQSTALPAAARPYKRTTQQPYPNMGMPGQMGPTSQMGQMGPMGPGSMGAQPMGGMNQGQIEGAKLLQAVRQKVSTIRGFDATITTYAEGHWKNGEKVGETRKSTTSARIIWMKPDKLRCEVITATNPLLEGAALATTDGRNITVRCKGLLSLIPIHLDAGDAKLTNNRNHSFTDTNPKNYLDRLVAPSAVWTIVNQVPVSGKMGLQVRVDNVRRLDGEVTGELITVDPRSLDLLQLTMFAGQKKVIEHTFTKFQWNPTVSSDKFSL